MGKYFCAVLILSALFLQGCNKNDLTVGKGEIHYDGCIYQLKNACHIVSDAEERGFTLYGVPYSARFHYLIFSGNDWSTIVTATIHSENSEIEGLSEFHVEGGNIKYEHNSIQMTFDLNDDFVHFANNHGTAKRKVHLSCIKKEDDIFEIEMKSVDNERDFVVKWKGPLKDMW